MVLIFDWGEYRWDDRTPRNGNCMTNSVATLLQTSLHNITQVYMVGNLQSEHNLRHGKADSPNSRCQTDCKAAGNQGG